MPQITSGRVLAQFPVGDLRLTETLHPARHRLAVHDHENPNINIVLEGGLQEGVERRSFDCGEGSALLKPPGARHSNAYLTADTRCLIVESMASSSRDCVFRHHEIVFSNSPRVRALSFQLSHEFRCHDSARLLILEGLALQLIGVLGREQGPDEKHRPRWLDVAREMLDAHFCGPLTLRQIGLAVGVDRGHLATQFKKHFHLSPGDYLRRTRVLAAADLIRAGGNLIETALQCGFYDQSHFSRTFRRFLGTTPGEFRRMCSSKPTKSR